jgi:hypothetical protein
VNVHPVMMQVQDRCVTISDGIFTDVCASDGNLGKVLTSRWRYMYSTLSEPYRTIVLHRDARMIRSDMPLTAYLFLRPLVRSEVVSHTCMSIRTTVNVTRMPEVTMCPYNT